MAATPVLALLFTVFQSIFQVFLVCFAGYYLASKGVADKRTQKALNHINVFLFTPALLFSKVAFSLTLEKLHELWVIPLFFFIVTGLSGIVANVLARMCRLRSSQRNFATAASMFMNSNSLPIALMQSLAASVPSLKWGPEDDYNAMFGRALTYLVVFSTLGMVLRWSYGVHLLSQADTQPEDPAQIRPANSQLPLPPGLHRDQPVHTPRLSVSKPDVSTGLLPKCDDILHLGTARTDGRLRPPPHLKRGRHHHHRTPPAVLGDELTDSSTSQTPCDSDVEPDPRVPFTSQPSQSSTRPSASSSHTHGPQHSQCSLITKLRSFHPSVLLRMPPPPLVASILALVFTIPPLQAMLKADVMIPVKGALEGAGACSVPITLVVLGGWFWEDDKKEPKRDKHDCTKGNVEERRPEQGVGSGVSITRSSSLSSMLNLVQDILKMRPLTWRKGGAIRLEGNEDIDHVDIEADAAADANVDFGRPWHSTSSTPRDSGDRSSSGAQKIYLGTDGPDNYAADESVLRDDRSSTCAPGETLTVVLTLLARMVIVPIMLLPLVALIKARTDADDSAIKVFDDPVFIVTTVLLVASPPAVTLAQISQRAASTMSSSTAPSASALEQASQSPPSDDVNSPFERLLSRTVFWSYCVLTPPITIVCVLLGLLMVQL